MNAASLRRAIVLLLVLILAALGALGYAFYTLRNASDSLDRAESQRIRSYQLAMELRQSSDDLTRMARAFVQTLQPEYERQY